MALSFLYIGDSLESVTLPTEATVPGIDTIHICVGQFGIDDVRRIKHEAYLRPVTEAFRTFVLSFQAATVEAQNALLKILEEPPAHTIFHVVVPNKDILLATVRSRLLQQVSNRDTTTHTVSFDTFESFRALTYGDRMLEIAKRAKDKDIVWMEDIVSGTEWYVKKHIQENKDLARSLFIVRKYFGTRGSSAKMLLEELALALPFASDT